MKVIVLASRNKDKIEELRTTLSSVRVELKSALDFAELQEVEEDQPTLEGNALKKARYVHQETGLPALADDTGLEVDALNGRPGVFSARFAKKNATYQDNVNKLLKELAEVSENERGAQFRTVAAFFTVSGSHTFEGICKGEITKNEKGRGGFGYDPVFKPKGYEKTFAELSTEEKNVISHRGKAVQKFLDWIKVEING